MRAAFDLLERVPSILVFLTALTVVSECCSLTGVFDNAADRIVHICSGKVHRTWWALMALSCLVTAFLSLDTTAVLMTSAAVAVARRLRRPIAAFAFPTLWIANMSSMWLPVSNLTTLLARDVLPRPDTLSYLGESWPIALSTTLTPLAVAAVMFRSDLAGVVDVSHDSCADASRETPRARTARREICAVLAIMSAGLLFFEPALVASLAALAATGVVFLRMPDLRRQIRLPWSSLGITTALFVAVAILYGSGLLNGLIAHLRHVPAWELGAVAGLGADIVNNLPAYLAFEPAARGDVGRLLALLIGVNVLSGMTWWGSVATLLWRDRLRRDGEHVNFGAHLVRTGIATSVTAAAAFIVLGLTH